MKPIVELISAWDDFTSERSTEVSVKEFCEFYLDMLSARKTNPTAEQNQDLAKVIGRLGSIQKTYSKIAFRQIPGAEFEWYFLLYAINNAGEIRKTEVVSFNLLLEPTTCIDIINRMIKAGLLNEKIDPYDKRAKLLTISEKGALLLTELQKLVDQTSALLYGQLDIDDKALLIKLLKAIETRHSTLLLNNYKRTN
jgi:DNA-binding MarR family transcriptional regulator